MGHADSPLATEGIAPVGEAGEGRSKRPQKTDENRYVGRGDPAVRPSEEVDDVEQDGERPGANRDIGEDRMKRMTQPGAVSQRLEVAPWFAEQFVGTANNLLKEIGDRL